MTESIFKGKAILILAVLSSILFIFNIASCFNSYGQSSARKKEMALRMEFEEKVNKFSQDKAVILEKLKAVENELDEEKIAHQADKKSLIQEQLVGKSLKEELDKVVKLKEALEENLKAALAVNNKGKMK